MFCQGRKADFGLEATLTHFKVFESTEIAYVNVLFNFIITGSSLKLLVLTV